MGASWKNTTEYKREAVVNGGAECAAPGERSTLHLDLSAPCRLRRYYR